MPKLIFKQADGTSVEVDTDTGFTIKDAAVDNMIPGIMAECGGQCVCGTCHVYIDERLFPTLESASELEQELIEGSMEHKDNSRLCCQVVITEDMDGMEVIIPARLY